MLFREEENEVLPFANRAEAGKILASKLSQYRGRSDVVVLGLPRGGIPVAFEVARALQAPLEAWVVRKLGVPCQPELAMGALAAGGVMRLDTSITRALGISREVIAKVAAQESKEVERQECLYRSGRPAIEVKGKTVILVDDGLATGSSMLAAVEAAGRSGAAHIVVAVPVAPHTACDSLKRTANEVVVVASPESFVAVSQWYEDFSQTTDDEVRALLQASTVSLREAG
jgi:predicted phosphoribosyltransferase